MQIEKIFNSFLIFTLILSFLFTTRGFAQDGPEENLRLRPNFKSASSELPEESLSSAYLSPSKNAVAADSKSLLKKNSPTDLLAPGDPDPAFAPNITNYPGSIRTTALQSDGKMLAGGFFKRINGEDHFGLVRFNANGTIDSGFAPKIGETVNSVVVQPDGKILIGGTFTRVNGVGRNRLARLNADGSLDPTFNPGGGPDNGVNTLSLLPDGKIIVGGFFTQFNGDSHVALVRLNTDGSLDNTFAPPLPIISGSVFALFPLPEGKFLVGGFYQMPGFLNVSTLLLFNADGSLDNSFNPGGVGGNSTIRAIELVPDGKFLIGGNFTTYNGVSRGRIARLNGDGTLDTTFINNTGANNTVYSFTRLRTTGGDKYIIGGAFSAYEGTTRNALAQLNSDGTLDTGFDVGSGLVGTVYKTTVLPSAQIFVGGNINQYNGFLSDIGFRINLNASVDTSFSLQTMAQATIRAVVRQPDGKVLVGGSFNLANNIINNGLVRFDTNGNIDSGFSTGAGPNGYIYTIALQPDGKILIGGNFTTFNGTTRNRLARLNANGTLDTAFAPNINNFVANITLLADGKILIGGQYTTVNGTSRQGIARLNSDGSLDSSFVPDTGAGFVEGIGVQPDGKIVIGGQFDQIGTTLRFSIARLNSNGSLDTSFAVPISQGSGIYSLALQPDGKILIGGVFSFFGIPNPRGIARLNPSGSIDDTFLVGTGTTAGDDVEDIVLQPDGRILIGGSINSINGVARSNLARLNANGTLDTSFNPVVDNDIWDINLEAGNPQRILIGGDFNSINNIQRTGVARLTLNAPFNRTPFDFDGDSKTDISIFRPVAGEWWLNRSSTGQTVAAQFGQSTDKPVPADFTGDGRADIAFWRPSTGEWFVLRSEDSSFLSFPFGSGGDVPVVGDFDADGKADPAIFRPSTGEWFILRSSGGVGIVTFGMSGDVPIPADYDGDGKTDVAIFRPSDGSWWYLRSSDLQYRVFRFGVSTDKPVQGDYTGDGKADIAVWRPLTGEWFVQRSEDNSFYSVPFGANGDLPTPGDYDGDGKFDTAVFRPSGSTWYINRSTAGILITGFGITGDQPIPNVFVP